MSLADNPDEILRQMEEQFAGITEPTDVENVREVPSPELAQRLHDIDKKLSSMGELTTMNPQTPEGRELHSRRVALLVEMRRRGLR